jgi:signal peptidase II
MTRLGLRVVLLVAIGATIGCDRATRHIAATMLSGTTSRSFLADTVRLEYVENVGAFLRLGADWPFWVRTALFGIGNAVLLFALAVNVDATSLVATSPPRIGSVCGQRDLQPRRSPRLWKGRRLHERRTRPLRTGIFNVADMAIMLGASIVVLAGYRFDRRT